MTVRFGNTTPVSTYSTPASPNIDRTLLGLGTMATQNASAVAITGGTAAFSSIASTGVNLSGGKINGIEIGATNASSATFTSVTATSAISAVSVTATSGISGSSGSFATVAVTSAFTAASYATTAAPAYGKGKVYFDTTLNKLRVGGATTWETITSV